MIYVNFDKYGVLNHIEYNDEVIFKGNNNVNKVFVCFDEIELKPQHYLTYSALINDKDYSGNLTDLASVRTTYNGKDGYMFSIFSNLTKDAGTLKLSVRLVDRLTDAILVSGILQLIVQDSAVSTYSNVNITTTQYQALLTAFDELAQTFNETNFKTINEESLFGEGNITLPTIEYVDSLDTNLREFVNDRITNLGYTDEELRNQIAEQNEVIEKQDKRIKVLELASEGNILLTNTEEDIAYEVNVTSDALPFAEINKIGGMTYKSNNELYYDDVAETTTNGITYSVVDGEIKVSGTATADGTFFIPISQYTMSGDHIVKLFKSGTFGTTNHYFTLKTTDNQTLITINLASDDSATYTSTSVILNGMELSYVSGQTYDFTIKPMLVEGTTAPTTWKVGFEGLRNSDVNQVVVKGANLFNPNMTPTSTSYTIVEPLNNGIKVINNHNSINGGVFSNVEYLIPLTNFIENETYKISFNVNVVGTNSERFRMRYVNDNGINLGTIGEKTNMTSHSQTFNLATKPSGATKILIQFYANNGSVSAIGDYIEYTDLYLGLASGGTFKPYKEPTIYTIPTTITLLDGYGQSNPNNQNEYNYIDFENKKFIAFGKIENGEWVSYETPNETNLQYHITDDFIIEIEGNGTIIFDNEYKNDIPFNWTYQEKL